MLINYIKETVTRRSCTDYKNLVIKIFYYLREDEMFLHIIFFIFRSW